MIIYRLVKAHGPVGGVMMYPFALNFIALLRKIKQIVKIHIAELYIIIVWALVQMPQILQAPGIPVPKNPIDLHKIISRTQTFNKQIVTSRPKFVKKKKD